MNRPKYQCAGYDKEFSNARALGRHYDALCRKGNGYVNEQHDQHAMQAIRGCREKVTRRPRDSQKDPKVPSHCPVRPMH